MIIFQKEYAIIVFFFFTLLSAKTRTGKADVWAVGALVYAMSVGNPAPEELATQPRSQLVSAVGHQTRSEALSLVAHRALDPDPSRRPSVHQVLGGSFEPRFLVFVDKGGGGWKCFSPLFHHPTLSLLSLSVFLGRSMVLSLGSAPSFVRGDACVCGGGWLPGCDDDDMTVSCRVFLRSVQQQQALRDDGWMFFFHGRLRRPQFQPRVV